MVEEARDELDRLFLMAGRSGHALLLTDGNGRRARPARNRWRREGFPWCRPVVGNRLERGERRHQRHRDGVGRSARGHREPRSAFLSSNTGLSCTAAPIRDHTARISGVLDFSTCRDDANELTMAMLSHAVRDAALRIEGNLFRRAFPTARIVMVGSGYGALLAVDRDDIVLGATRGARQALGLDDHRLAAGVPAADLLNESEPARSTDLLEAERSALRRAINRNGGNMSRTAEALGISRATLHRKVKRLGLT